METKNKLFDFIKKKENYKNNSVKLENYFENFSTDVLKKIKAEELKTQAKNNSSKTTYLLVSIAALFILVLGIIYLNNNPSSNKELKIYSKIEKQEFKSDTTQTKIKIVKDSIKKEKVEVKKEIQIKTESKSFQELLNELDDDDIIIFLNSSEVDLEDLDS